MGGKTTDDGLQEGVLLCENLSDKCSQPTLEACQCFTLPAYDWIRRAASNLHSLLDGFHETLQSQIIQASLDIGRMVKDFAAEPLQKDAGPNVGQILSIFANALGLFGSVSKFAAAAALNAHRLNAIANGAGIASNAVFVFKSMDEVIANLTRLVFTGEENRNYRGMTFDYIQVLPSIRLGHAAPPVNFAHPISQSFGGGEFLLDVENEGKARLEESFRASITNVQRSLISGLLHDLCIYVVKDSSRDGQTRCGETAEPGRHDRLHNWGIDVEQVYRNAEACRAAHGFGGWEAYYNEIGGNVHTGADSFGYAPCFWGSLPVFEVTDQSREKSYFSVAVDGVCRSTSIRGPEEAPDAPGHLGIGACPLVSLVGF
ncbi:hypothetical protein ACHAQH_010019 [Verticillium albo-atrum]